MIPLYTFIGLDSFGREEYSHEMKESAFFQDKILRGIGWPENRTIQVQQVLEEHNSFIGDEFIDGQNVGRFAYSFNMAGWTVVT